MAPEMTNARHALLMAPSGAAVSVESGGDRAAQGVSSRLECGPQGHRMPLGVFARDLMWITHASQGRRTRVVLPVGLTRGSRASGQGGRWWN